jgi:multiple sugar transport system permease protein
MTAAPHVVRDAESSAGRSDDVGSARGRGRTPATRRPGAARAGWTAWAFLAPVVAYLVLFYAVPIVRNVAMGFQEYTVRSFVTGEAPFVGFDNYAAVVADPLFWPTVANTAVFTVASLVFQYGIGLALAEFFSRHFPLSALLRSLFLLPWLLPLIVSGSVWRWMLDKDNGIVNAALGLVGVDPVGWTVDPRYSLLAVIVVNIWIGVPFNMVILYGGLQAVPASLHEAAALDGAGRWRTFRSITFPLLRPVTTVVLLLGLVYTLKVFDVIWITTQGGPANSSQTLATWSYQLSFGPQLEFGLGAAAGNLLIALALVFGLWHIRAQRTEEES